MRIALFIFVAGCPFSSILGGSGDTETDFSEIAQSAGFKADVRKVGVQWVGTVTHHGVPRAVYFNIESNWMWADTNIQVPSELEKRLRVFQSLERDRAKQEFDASSRELALRELEEE